MNFHAREIIADHPDIEGGVDPALIACIEACYACAQAGAACADSCLAEPDVSYLRQCIRLNLDCADICYTAGVVASRRTGENASVVRALLQTCKTACEACATECEQHGHDHCRICAEACWDCAAACEAALAVI